MILILFIILSSTMFLFYTIYFVYMHFNSKTENYSVEKINEYNPLVSVVIPTYNEEVTIKKKLSNIFEQNYANFDVYIIDSASKDRTADIINEFINENDVIFNFIVEKERKGKSSALNRIIKEVKGEIIAITDSDVLWEENVITNMVKNFNDEKIGAITGRQIIIDSNRNMLSKSEKAYKNIFDILRKGESNLDSTPIFNGPAMAFRTKLLDHLPEDTIADDTQLAMMIRKKGFKTIFDENVIFYESVPDDQIFINQKIRRGQGLVQAFLRNLDFLFNPKFGKFGLIIFPAEFFMHIVSPIISLVLSTLFFILIFNNSLLLYASIISSIALILISRLNVLKVDKIIFAFIEYQFILLLALIKQSIGIKQHKWNVANRKVIEIDTGE